MTVIHQEIGYQDPDYLEEAFTYLDGAMIGYMGFQANIVIVNELNPVGQQGLMVIEDDKPVGQQVEATISVEANSGQQVEATINAFPAYGMQADITNVDYLDELGMQAEVTATQDPESIGQQAETTVNAFPAFGMQVAATKSLLPGYGMQAEVFVIPETAYGFEATVTNSLSHVTHSSYLNTPYLEDPYLSSLVCVNIGFQADINNDVNPAFGMQAEITILPNPTPFGMQAEITNNVFPAFGMQADTTVNFSNDCCGGIQAEIFILADPDYAMQARTTIADHLEASGQQANILQTFKMGMQGRVVIYNTTNLRIMCEFASRGETTSNWTASSTEPGDFSINNLDTDIQEQIWRSATGIVTGINLDSDIGLPQGVVTDTVAILNHNLTSSASVTLLGSDSPTFASVGTIIPMEVTDTNMYYIAPTLPNVSHRYWRFVIDDVTNPTGFVSIGIILFGTTQIFQGECFTDFIRFGLKDFVDKVQTEGFTNVSNSRAIKRQLGLEFRSLRFEDRNMRILRGLFEQFRTTHKCLWIPTPSATDQEVTGRFAVFGKLSTIPQETHNSKGPEYDYVDLTVDVDESL